MFNRELVVNSIKELVGYSPAPELEASGDLVAGDPFSQADKKHPLIIHRNIEQTKPLEEPYDEYLQRVREESILEAVQDLFDYKHLNHSVKQLIADVKGIFGDRMTHDTAAFLNNGFVGHRFRANKRGSRSVVINKIGINLLKPQQDFKIYVFRGENFNREDAVKEITINYDGHGSYKWYSADARLTFVEDTEAYYIGFFEDDLSATANTYMTRPFDFTKSCGSCNVYDNARYKSWNPFIGIFPVTADPETGSVIGTNKKTYGLNLSFTVECDVTAVLLSNRGQIARLALEKMVIRHLNELVNSVEIGKIPDRTRSLASLALEGSFTSSGSHIKGTGLLTKYKEIVAQTSFELTGLGDDCLKCDKDSGIIRWT